jgi:hypothetical protein
MPEAKPTAARHSRGYSLGWHAGFRLGHLGLGLGLGLDTATFAASSCIPAFGLKSNERIENDIQNAAARPPS